jgi:hypothetical protein
VTFTADGGMTRALIQTPAATNYFTYGVAALAGGSTLAAIVGTTTYGDNAQLYFSTDAGCSWQPSGQTLPSNNSPSLARLVSARDHAYVWGWSSGDGQSIHVIDRTGVTRRFSLEFESWQSGPYGFGVDPNDPTRVRIAVHSCIHRASCGRGSIIWETTNEGATWTTMGVAVPHTISTPMRFSPTNFDHVVSPYGVQAPYGPPAGHVTFDGGNQWLEAQGLPTNWQSKDAAIGPDGQTVWLLAEDSSSNLPLPFPTAMYVSHDGGLNYQEAFVASEANPFFATLPYAGPQLPSPPFFARMFPHPSNADIVYLTYTTATEGKNYLYRYDAGLDQLEKQEWPSAHGGVWGLAFNPADPDRLYLGLSAAE